MWGPRKTRLGLKSVACPEPFQAHPGEVHHRVDESFSPYFGVVPPPQGERLDGPRQLLSEHLLHVALEQRDVEIALRREVLVNQRLRDAGRLGDLVDRGSVVATAGEDFQRGFEDRLAALLRGESLARGGRLGGGCAGLCAC